MLVLAQKERCGDWAKARIPEVDSWGDWYEAIGWERNGELVACAVYDHYSGAEIYMHVATSGPQSLTKGAICAAFRYPFVQLGCRRVTAEIASQNSAAIRLIVQLGFRYEGTKWNAFEDDDACVYGLLKEDCRWLK